VKKKDFQKNQNGGYKGKIDCIVAILHFLLIFQKTALIKDHLVVGPKTFCNELHKESPKKFG
jgi:hypothetical protein